MGNLQLTFQCPSCGSTEGVDHGTEIRCKHCGNKYRKSLKNEPVYADLSYAVNERQEADFDKARRRYDALIKQYQSGSGMEEAYWGRFLCEQYVIFYQNDAGESIPSFWNINDEPCQKSASYQKALEYGAQSGNLENYEKLAEQMGDEMVIAKLNIDEVPLVAHKEAIEVIPTLVLYRNGKALGSIVAPESKARIEQFIEESLV